MLQGKWAEILIWLENSSADRKTAPHIQDDPLQSQNHSLLKHQSILNTIKLNTTPLFTIRSLCSVTTFGLASFSIIMTFSCYICLLHFNMHGNKMPVFIWIQLLMCIHTAAPGVITLYIFISPSTA